jgi:hypothetical protein
MARTSVVNAVPKRLNPACNANSLESMATKGNKDFQDLNALLNG